MSTHAPGAHIQNSPPAAVIGMFPGSGGHIVIAKGQYSPRPRESQRFLIHTGTQALTQRADVWMTAAGLHAVLESLGARHAVSLGECDSMYATRPCLVWADVQESLHLWKRGTLVGQFAADCIRIRSGRFGRWTVLPADTVRECHGYLADGWYQRGVALVLSDGGRRVVSRKRELSVLLDPTYDGLDLLADAAWVDALASAICRKTLLAKRLDEGL